MSDASQAEVKLSIKPFTPSTLPSADALIDVGKKVLGDLEKWKQGKTFQGTLKGEPYNVKTYSKAKEPGDEAAWHGRISEHNDGTFDEFWEKLGRDKAPNEKEFTPEIKKATLLKQISPTQSIWTLHYHLMPPISDRIFTVLQTTHLEGGDNGTPRQGWIISNPVDVSEDADMKAKEDKGVKGRYCSVELIKEGKDGIVEWWMATSSTPGGSIPQFITERSMPSQIFKDVPHFTHWLKGLKAAAAKPTQTPVANGNAESHAGNGTTPAKEVVAPAEPVSEAAAETITGGTGEPVPTGTQTTTT